MGNSNRIETFALVGFIVGLISWIINLWGLVGIVAVVFSVLALNKKVEGTSKTFSIIGLVSGGINILYAFAVIVSMG